MGFLFPKGFCKNDNNYDVNLTIEALALEQAGRKFKQPNKVGEAKFAIYPRTDAPRANLLVDRGENYYKYAGIITLLRPFTKSSISMHCGRISYSVAFREDVEATDVADRNGEIQAKPMPKPRNPSRKKNKTPPKPPSPEIIEDFTDVSETLSVLERRQARGRDTPPQTITHESSVTKETRTIEVQTSTPTPSEFYLANSPLETKIKGLRLVISTVSMIDCVLLFHKNLFMKSLSLDISRNFLNFYLSCFLYI